MREASEPLLTEGCCIQCLSKAQVPCGHAANDRIADDEQRCKEGQPVKVNMSEHSFLFS